MKAKKKLFKLFTGLYSALLDSMIVAFCISIMKNEGSLNQPRHHEGLWWAHSLQI